MAYTPPSGGSIAFAIDTGYDVPLGTAMHFTWGTLGDGLATVTFLAAASGVIGVTAAGVCSNIISGFGECRVYPIGAGEARFSVDTLASGVGFVAAFGMGAAQLRVSLSAKAVLAPFGSASISLAPIVDTCGYGDAVRVTGDIVMPFIAHGAGSVNEVVAAITGSARATLTLSAQGAGRAALAGQGLSAVRFNGLGQARVGVTGCGAALVPAVCITNAVRGVSGAAVAHARLKGGGRAGIGVSGFGVSGLPIVGTGGAGFTTPVIGRGASEVHVVALGYAERVIDFSDLRIDRVFVRSVQRNVFVRGA